MQQVTSTALFMARLSWYVQDRLWERVDPCQTNNSQPSVATWIILPLFSRHKLVPLDWLKVWRSIYPWPRRKSSLPSPATCQSENCKGTINTFYSTDSPSWLKDSWEDLIEKPALESVFTPCPLQLQPNIRMVCWRLTSASFQGNSRLVSVTSPFNTYSPYYIDT